MRFNMILATLTAAFAPLSLATPTYVKVKAVAGRWVVEVPGYVSPVTKLKGLLTKEIEPDAKGEVKLQRADYPEILKNVKSLSVLTIQGLQKLTLEEAAVAMPSCGYEMADAIFDVKLKEAPSSASGNFAIGILRGDFPAKAFLKTLKEAKGEKQKTLAQKIWSGILGKVAPDMKVQWKSLSAAQVHLVPITSGPARWLAWIYKKDGYIWSVAYTGLFDSTGNLVHTLGAKNVDSSSEASESYFEPMVIADLNGDGTEELIGEWQGFEDAATVILEWKNSKFTETYLEMNGGC